MPRASRPDPVASENPPLRFALQYVDSQHPYLASRGVKPEAVRTFGLGFYTGKGLLRGRIVIPIHNASGELIAYAGRAIDGQEPKYRFPAGFRKSLVLFNLHRAIATNARTVVVVEGFFDTIGVHQAGYAVVGLMGSTLSRRQSDQLVNHFHRVLLMLDDDEAGRQGATMMAQARAPRTAVAVAAMENGRQPDQLAPGDIHRLVQAHLNEEASVAPRSSMMERTTAHEQSCSGMNREVPVVAVSEPELPQADDSEREGRR